MRGVGDFNGDSKSDLFWVNKDTFATAIWLMDGSSMIGEWVPGSSNGETFQGVGDFDGDARADVLWRNLPLGRHHVEGEGHRAAVLSPLPRCIEP